MSLTLILLSYAIRQCTGDTFTGNTFTSDREDHYQNHTIQCNDNEDCSIICKHPNACKHTHIQCPSTATCAIQCNSGLSDNVCEGITIECPSNGDCNIQCNDDTACTDAIINGKTSDLFLSCHGDKTCAHTTIHGRNTAHLSIQCGKVTHNECSSLCVYFPPNVGHHKMATIDAGDSLCSGSDDDDPLQFYAVNGWNDVDIVYYSGDFENHIGVMRCGEEYDVECSFEHDSWRCNNNLCNNPQLDSQTVTGTSVSASVFFYAVIGTSGICLLLIGFACLCFVHYSQTQNHKLDKTLTCNSNYAKTQSSSSLPRMISDSSFTFGQESSSRTATTASLHKRIWSKTPELDIIPVFSPHVQIQIEPKLELTFNKTDETISSIEPEVKTNETEGEETNHKSMYLSANYSTQTPVSIDLPHERSYAGSASMTSSADLQISYVPPPQQEISQIMSILNESLPPSLSSFVRNHENGAYVMNQQPIPPSAQSSTASITGTMDTTINGPDINGIYICKENINDLNEISMISSEDSGKEDSMIEDVVDDNVHNMEYRLQIARNYLAENREME